MLPVDESPDVLLIMCDQLSANVLSCYGGPVTTPNLDRLADQSVRFTNATCPAPFCTPSRASLLTGLYPHTHGIVYNVMIRDYPEGPRDHAETIEEGLTNEDVTTDSLLHAAGYDTHHYGKWHLQGEDLTCHADPFREFPHYQDQMRTVFDRVRQKSPSQWMNWYGLALPVTVSDPVQRAVAAVGEDWRPSNITEHIRKIGRLELPMEQVFDVQVADRTIAALQRRGDAPFMITCSFLWPHDPNVVPSPYYEMFDPDQIKMPANYEQFEPRFETDKVRRFVADLGEPVLREFMRIYYGCVRLIDDQVGRILDALDASSQAENCIVVFLADHGDLCGGHGMLWKSHRVFYEELVHVPLMIRYPRHIAPSVNANAVGLTDIMPTLLDLTGQSIPEHVQGRSVAPHLLGGSDIEGIPAFQFCENLVDHDGPRRRIQPHAPADLMVRGQGWKYIRYANDEEMLFDLVNDPGETRNLSHDPKAQTSKQRLATELNTWLNTSQYPGWS